MLILASGSPRRREILDLFEVPYRIEESMIDETILLDESPSEVVHRLAQAKGAVVLRAHAGSAVLSADTVVSVDGHILGKPSDAKDARSMLQRLSGRSHTVFTGIALQRREAEPIAEVARAEVWFRDLTGLEIDAYVASGEPFGKAGAYAVQGLGGSLVRQVRGELSTVVGLTVSVTAAFLTSFGIRHSLDRPRPSKGGSP